MKTYLKYIFLVLILGLTAISCQKELEPSSRPLFDGEALTLVPRVKSFANQYVTKADDKTAYTDNEKIITRLAILVFDNNGNLIHIQEGGNDDGISSLSVNKSVLNTTTRAEVLDEATVVMFANISLDAIQTVKDGVTSTIRDIEKLEELGNYSYHFANSTTETDVVVTDLENNFKGFPMVGTATVDLRPTTTQQDAVSVNLKILYAKIKFNISVADGSENQSLIQNGPSFSLSGYSINNVAKVASYNEPAEGAATANNDYAYINSSNPETTVTVSKTGTATKNSNPLEFTFYVAESRYNPKSDGDGRIDLTGIYPSDEWLTPAQNEDVKNYSSLSEEQKALAENKLNGVKYVYDNLIQQYKPKLATAEAGSPATGLATYVTVNGTYKDYRGTDWTVNYKIYLGKDNAHNFHVDRNSEYTNILTIKGIRNNNSYGEDNVWIDHRVNVSTEDAAKHITITRETLIDSHIEVRPLRVDLSNTDYLAIKLTLPDVDWIAAEHFNGKNCQDGSIYCYNSAGKSTGKRKYFTTSLISELKQFGTTMYLADGDCAWIYFDENTSSTTRKATITLDFLDKEGEVIDNKREIYEISQCELQTVGDQNLGYYTIESYEEYLHTYDSADKYNLTTSPIDYTQQGLEWGLDGEQISQNIITSASSWPGVSIYASLLPKYDFFHKSDDPKKTYVWYSSSKNWVTLTEQEILKNQTGLWFTESASDIKNIKVKDMGTLPENAYQYCLSKNKFTENADGTVSMDVHWYLPDVYEIQTMLQKPASNNDLKTDGYYWSSQPSFGGFNSEDIWEAIGINVGIDVSLKEDDTKNARAASKTRIDNFSRTTKNRIRCFYSREAAPTNMKDRIPDGVGGNYTFYMSAFENKVKNNHAFFKSLLDNEKKADLEKDKNERTVVIQKQTNGEWKYTDNTYAYPTENNLGEFNRTEYYFTTTDNNGVTVKGFKVDITNSNYWDEGDVLTGDGTYYTTLATFPGLSIYELEKHWARNYYKETSNKKTDTKSDIVSTEVNLSKYLSGLTLNQPDHPSGNRFSISFSNGVNNTYSPMFEYDEVENKTELKYTRHWKVEYPESEYTTPKSTTYPTHDYSGQSTKTVREWKKDDAISQSYSQAYEAAKGVAKQNLIDYVYGLYPNCDIFPDYSTEDYVETDRKDDGYSVSIYYKNECTVTLKCIMKFKVVSQGTKVKYYAFPTESPWVIQKADNGKEYEELPPINGHINTDEMRMFRGNSITISSNDPDYLITKVRVYLKGGNQLLEPENLNTKNTYGRLVDKSIIPSDGTDFATEDIYFTLDDSEPIQLTGMQYSGNSANQEVWQEWTGSVSSLELSLTDYIVENIELLGYHVYTKYTYTMPQTKANESVIIDRIEVKCTKKKTSNQ